MKLLPANMCKNTCQLLYESLTKKKYRIGGIKARQTPGCPTLPLWTDTGVKASCATLRGQSARGTGLMLPSCAPSPLAGTVLGFLVPTTLRK